MAVIRAVGLSGDDAVLAMKVLGVVTVWLAAAVACALVGRSEGLLRRERYVLMCPSGNSPGAAIWVRPDTSRVS